MIFITGGTGMLGAHLLYELVRKNPIVRASKRPTSDLNTTKKIFSFYDDNPEILFDRIEWVDVDLLDYYSIEKALKGITKVYHCAAMVSFNKKDQKKMFENNVTGTANLVNTCLENNVEKLIHVSSIAALGRTQKGETTTERTPWKDSDKDSPYSISKHQSELEVRRGIAEGLNAVIINPSVILGPGEWTKGSPSFFPLIAKGMKFYTHATNGYVGVQDVCKVMLQLMDSEISGERFIVNAENLTYLEVFNMIAKSIGAKYPSVEAKPWMLNLAWRLAKIPALFTGRTPQFTRSITSSFMNSHEYSSQKLEEAIDFDFTAMQKIIGEIGEIYLKDK